MGQTILIVEDERDIILILKEMLEKDNYRIIEAHDGLEALEKVRTERPDLVIMDIMIPRLDGYSVNMRLKDDPATARLPVIVITGRAHMEELLKVRGELSVAAYLEKPFRVSALVERVKELLPP